LDAVGEAILIERFGLAIASRAGLGDHFGQQPGEAFGFVAPVERRNLQKDGAVKDAPWGWGLRECRRVAKVCVRGDSCS
jgi:hypothetical protein